MKGREIAATLGVSHGYVKRLLNPRSMESSRTHSAYAKRLRTGRCVDCGSVTRYNGHGVGVSERCVRCANVRIGAGRTYWTVDRIIAAMHAWHAEHGRPPVPTDWLRADPERRWPSFTTVVRAFGSWSAGRRAAGYGDGRASNGRRRQS